MNFEIRINSITVTGETGKEPEVKVGSVECYVDGLAINPRSLIDSIKVGNLSVKVEEVDSPSDYSRIDPEG